MQDSKSSRPLTGRLRVLRHAMPELARQSTCTSASNEAKRRILCTSRKHAVVTPPRPAPLSAVKIALHCRV
eukprot:5948895-Amphidinium_carterae.1